MSVIYILNFFFRLGFQATQPMVGLYMVNQGVDPGKVGLILGAVGIVPVGLATFLGKLVDHIGTYRQVLLGSLLSVAGYLLLSQAKTPVFIGIYLAIGWLGNFATTIAYQTHIAEARSDGSNVQPFAWLGVSTSLANSAAPAMAGIIAGSFGIPAVFVVSAFLSGFVFLGLPELKKGNIQAKRTQISSEALTERFWFMNSELLFSIAAIFLTGLIVGHRNTFLAVYFDSIGITIQMIGFLLSAQALTSFAVQSQLGRLAKRFSAPKLIVTAFLIATIALGLIPIFNDVYFLFLFMCMLGIVSSMLYPLTMAFTASSVPPERQGMALGIRETSLRFGNILGPPLFGLVAGYASVAATYFVLSAITASGFLAGWFTLARGWVSGNSGFSKKNGSIG